VERVEEDVPLALDHRARAFEGYRALIVELQRAEGLRRGWMRPRLPVGREVVGSEALNVVILERDGDGDVTRHVASCCRQMARAR
jgi:hypothetical protein